MKKTHKILVSIPLVVFLVYVLIFPFNSISRWLYPTMNAYYIQVGILQVSNLVIMVVLLRKLWSFKHIERSKKTEWTWLLILFPPVSSVIFVWKSVDRFRDLNAEVEHKISAKPTE